MSKSQIIEVVHKELKIILPGPIIDMTTSYLDGGMFEFICRSVLNNYLLSFLQGYCDEYTECTCARETLLKTIVELEKKKEDNAFCEKHKSRDIAGIGQMFINSFRPYSEKLKQCDDSIFDENNIFIQHLQLQQVWQKMLPEQKQTVWNYLNGAYLILEIFVLLPEAILNNLTDIISLHFHQVFSLKKDFQKEQFKEDLKEIIRTLEDRDLKKIALYLWEFINSTNSPLYGLIDEKFHNKLHLLLSIAKTENGRAWIFTKFNHFIQSVKNKVGDIQIQFDAEGVKYDGELKIALKTYEAECIAQEYNDRIILKFEKSSAEQPELQSIVENWCSELQEIRKHYNSFNLNYNYFRLQSQSYQISQDYQAAVNICTEAENYLAAHPHLTFPARFGEFALQKLSCYLNLKEYEKGKEAVNRCSEIYAPGLNNWFIFMELNFYLAMHTQHFEEAEKVFIEVTQHPRYAFQPDHKKENWKLLELYMRFALSSEQKDQAQAQSAAFDLKKFLRAVPSYKGDKRGYNVAILILHVLYLLDNNDFGDIIGRMDALRTYRTRYLRATSNKQSALFFRMLQIMETNNFSYEITKQKAQRYYDKMVSMNAEYTEIQDGLQVLPFDWLWRKILDMLKQKEEQGIIQKVMK